MDMKYFENHVEAQRAAIRYVKADLCIPNDLEYAATRALKELRNHLDECGKRMPAPRFYYDVKDKETWMYLDVAHTKRLQTKEIINPNFKYKHVF